MEELAEHFKWRSSNSAMSYFRALEKKGYLERRKSKYRFTKFNVALALKDANG
jgi:DNA-binding MarR family transcriptional regulator